MNAPLFMPQAKPLVLRDYQRTALDGIYNYFEFKIGNPLVVIPTGGGKSLVIAEFIRDAVTAYPNTRILVVTHVKELIKQNFDELMGVWPQAPAGIYSAGMRKWEIQAQVLFCGIQSIWKCAYDLQKVDLILIDEAHLIPRSSNTTYRRFIDDLLIINPDLKIIGFTATPFRLDSGMLHEGDDAVFSDIAYEVNVRTLIEQGYLSPLVSMVGNQEIDTTNVGTRGGEFIANQLEAAATNPETVAAIADETVAAGHDRRGWIMFGCGVHHCTMLADAIRERGFSCETIFGDTPAAERDRIISDFKAQKIRCLSSMGVLTTGFNAKHVDLIAVARPTKSTGLWIQIAGRGTRLFEGKKNCLVLDFGGNIERHGPIDRPKVKTKGKGDGVAPTKTCPACEESCPISAQECPACGYKFDMTGSKVSTTASNLSILYEPPKPEWVTVYGVTYSRHRKPGKPDSLKVTYNCGMLKHSEWVCLEHDGYARTKAEVWWRKRGPGTPVPVTVEDALRAPLDEFLERPVAIKIRPDGKFTQIIDYQFVESDVAAAAG